MIALVAVVLCLRPSDLQTYHVDICELNHVLNSQGQETLTQWIWLDYDWHLEYGWDYYVRDWRLSRDVPAPTGRIQEWYDKKTGQHLRVIHRLYRETWSYGDVETFDRNRLPEAERRTFGSRR